MIGDLFKYWTYQVFSPGTILREKYEAFKSLLEHDQRAHEGMAELQRICYEALPVDGNRIIACYDEFSRAVGHIVDRLAQMCPGCYSDLKGYYTKFDQYIRFLLAPPDAGHMSGKPYTLPLSLTAGNELYQVGGKAHALIGILQRLQLPVPRGFVITTNAFYYLIEHNRLRPAIDRALARIHPDDPSMLASVSKELTAVMMGLDIPSRLETAVASALDQLLAACGGDLQLAVRSSAVAEDSVTSFAGQYRSCLQVKPADLFQAYRRVLASKFEPTALYYRIRSGLEDGRTPMAVMVMEMIDPLVSGVLYTRGPSPDKADMISIHYVDGLGEALVSGNRQARVISMPHPRRAHPMDTDQAAIGAEDAVSPPLDAKTLSRMVRWAMQLEDFLETPCDVEWCQDRSGRLRLLQCRPLPQQSAPPQRSVGDSGKSHSPGARLLFQGGLCASGGTGGGPVYKVETEADLASVPDHSVAILTTAPPHYVSILDRVNAVIVAQGSVAGHFQAVAREFNVPTLVNAARAGHVLKPGEPVTVDAGARKVFAGCSSAVSSNVPEPGRLSVESPILRKLAAAMGFIAPLALTDPHAASFSPQSCRSMHDIIRFAHEKAVHEMFAIGDRRLKRKKGARQLVGELPMVIYVLDVGGGIQDAQSHSQSVNIEHIRCEPMLALWQGLRHPDIQWAGHRHFDWAEYDRVVMTGGIISPDSVLFSSYAVVADRYLNFCLKFGYHFAIIDALFQQPPKTGHIWFRFTGGGGEPEGRLLRVRFIRRVLTALGFRVKTEGELINARLDGEGNPAIATGLVRIGHLLGVTRLMDMHLKDDTELDHLSEAFLKEQFLDFIWEEEGDLTP